MALGPCVLFSVWLLAGFLADWLRLGWVGVAVGACCSFLVGAVGFWLASWLLSGRTGCCRACVVPFWFLWLGGGRGGSKKNPGKPPGKPP